VSGRFFRSSPNQPLTQPLFYQTPIKPTPDDAVAAARLEARTNSTLASDLQIQLAENVKESDSQLSALQGRDSERKQEVAALRDKLDSLAAVSHKQRELLRVCAKYFMG